MIKDLFYLYLLFIFLLKARELERDPYSKNDKKGIKLNDLIVEHDQLQSELNNLKIELEFSKRDIGFKSREDKTDFQKV